MSIRCIYSVVYIPVITHQQPKNSLKKKYIKKKKNQCKKTTSRILQLKRWFVFSSIFYEIEPLELGDKMSLTILQQSVRYSCSSSWQAFKVLTKTIEATYLPLKLESRKITPWIFALPSGMAFNAVDRLVCCLQFSRCTVQRLTHFFFPFLVFPWIALEFLLQMMNQLGQCKCILRKKIYCA